MIGWASVIMEPSGAGLLILQRGRVAEPNRLATLVGTNDTGGASRIDVLADLVEDAVRRDVVTPARPKIVDQGVELVAGDLVEVAVVHLQARRLRARRDALVAVEGEEAVGGGASLLDAEAILGVLEQLVATVQVARDRRAHVDHVLAHRLALEHLVEAGRPEHLRRF